jgi:hypothetical protein
MEGNLPKVLVQVLADGVDGGRGDQLYAQERLAVRGLGPWEVELCVPGRGGELGRRMRQEEAGARGGVAADDALAVAVRRRRGPDVGLVVEQEPLLVQPQQRLQCARQGDRVLPVVSYTAGTALE